jgi:CRISPR/Cas system-associated exonuclease Cas4 (RecB family)
MKHGKDEKDYISATDISEYIYCSVAWYLDKEGFPRSKKSSRRFRRGTRKHRFLLRKYNALKVGIVVSSIIAVVLLMVIIVAVM